MNDLAPKASSRISLNGSLLAATMGIFFLVISFRLDMLTANPILAFQLVSAIPLFLTSNLSYSKIGYRNDTKNWNRLAWLTFIVGYSFILNVIGALSAKTLGQNFGILFFIFSWALSIIYSIVDIKSNKSHLIERIVKTSLFILIQLFLGLFLILNIF